MVRHQKQGSGTGICCPPLLQPGCAGIMWFGWAWAAPCQSVAILLDCSDPTRPEARMVPFFVQIKCQLGQSYSVANKLADAEIASEIYSTAGEFDLLVKFYVEESLDIGHFVNEKVQTIPGIQDTRTIITFKAF
jgi:DNA-binding Lrp family transcriptional regulator